MKISLNIILEEKVNNKSPLAQIAALRQIGTRNIKVFKLIGHCEHGVQHWFLNSYKILCQNICILAPKMLFLSGKRIAR